MLNYDKHEKVRLRAEGCHATNDDRDNSGHVIDQHSIECSAVKTQDSSSK